jgi:hypothetical protein
LQKKLLGFGNLKILFKLGIEEIQSGMKTPQLLSVEASHSRPNERSTTLIIGTLGK